VNYPTHAPNLTGIVTAAEERAVGLTGGDQLRRSVHGGRGGHGEHVDGLMAIRGGRSRSGRERGRKSSLAVRSPAYIRW
jgi:hypothetical protein